MKKKDLIVIVVIVALAACSYFGYKFWLDSQKKGEEQMGLVYHRDQIVLAFEVNTDKVYDLDGTYGHLQLEVLEGKWRITNEECPNHICSKMGWVGVDDIIPIVCLPNEISVTYTPGE